MACPLPPVATMVPDITVPPLLDWAGKALLVCAPMDRTRTGKSVPGGSAVAGRGTAVPAAAGAGAAEVLPVAVAALLLSWVLCLTVVAEMAAGCGGALVCPALVACCVSVVVAAGDVAPDAVGVCGPVCVTGADDGAGVPDPVGVCVAGCAPAVGGDAAPCAVACGVWDGNG